jgi:hypothetical protein
VSYQTVNLHKDTHKMLEEIKEAGYKVKSAPTKAASKSAIIHELVSKLHKKECK